jgi:diguanylate cyclase (GGDEF)-like protein
MSPAAAVPGEARETSGATTALVLEFLRGRGGDAAVQEALGRAGIPTPVEQLSRPDHWISYDARIRLFSAATEVLGDPDTMFRVGREALAHGMNPGIVLLVRAIGSPRQVYRQLPRAVAKFSTTSTMKIVDSGSSHVTIDFRLHDGYRHSRLDCDYARGLIGMVPVVFGLPEATVLHNQCESDGYPSCVYHVTWENKARRRLRRRAAVESTAAELAALRQQLRGLQSAASELVAGDDLQTALHTIVRRAGEAVLAPAYLLAVSDPDGGAPLVQSYGVAEDQVAELAHTLLDTGDLGPSAVVVDVVSARRRHGRLAALYRPGDGAIGDERSMLSAYAGHAAAALDLLMALEGARREADRAGALLAVAHLLAAATDAPAICHVVTDALRRIVGCTSAGTMLWDAGSGLLRSQAVVGYPPEVAAFVAQTPLRPEEVPELVGMLSDREPRILRPADVSPGLRGQLEARGVSVTITVPLLAGSAFLGVVNAGWGPGEEPVAIDDVLARLRGVGDLASTALQKARLLETVRHQATHDALTGLPNRVLFLERLHTTLAGCGPDRLAAVVFCDLDRFKEVNDTLGHAAGDELLRQVAARLSATVRPGDTVGRLSGDEFAILLSDVIDTADARAVVDRVLSCFDEPFRLEGRDVRIGTSVGVALRTDPEATAEQLLRKADIAMYEHKNRERRASPR